MIHVKIYKAGRDVSLYFFTRISFEFTLLHKQKTTFRLILLTSAIEYPPTFLDYEKCTFNRDYFLLSVEFAGFFAKNRCGIQQQNQRIHH